MDDMQGGTLVEFFAEDKEDCVEKVSEFWEEVPPGHGSFIHTVYRLCIVYGLADPIVSSQEKKITDTAENPEAKEGLKEVVGNHNSLNIKGWSILHEPWCSKANQNVVHDANCSDRPGGWHEQPVVQPKEESDLCLRFSFVNFWAKDFI